MLWTNYEWVSISEIRKDNIRKGKKLMEEIEVNQMSPLVWAYIGDSVYEQYIRNYLVTNTKFFYGGPNFSEVIEVLQKYGAYNAANLDGGSSATLIIENKVINTPRDLTTGVINPRGTVSGFCFK